uniref:Uncharacterized protein n=1 Tax=Oryza glumipatula TaxID=40148 RepID=A0A0D9ZPJ4_9ORYZ
MGTVLDWNYLRGSATTPSLRQRDTASPAPSSPLTSSLLRRRSRGCIPPPTLHHVCATIADLRGVRNTAPQLLNGLLVAFSE